MSTAAEKMTSAERELLDREFKTGTAPFAVYCYTCNVIMQPGTAVKRYDGATYTHFQCPTTPHKTFAAHKYGSAR